MFFFVFCAFMDLDFVLVHLDAKKGTQPISSHPELMLSQQRIIIYFMEKFSLGHSWDLKG